MQRRALAVAAAVALSAALAGCPGSLDSPERFDDQFNLCPNMPTYFSAHCASAGCHAATNPANGLDLVSGNLVERISGKKSSTGMGLLIDPTTPENSVIYTKVTSAPPFGARMPLGGATLDDSMQDCVLEWIQSSTKGQ